MLTIARILRPQRPTPQKLIAYESGVDPVGGDWAQSQIRYYVFAVLFVLFDVEAVFIFPWATRLEVYGTFGLVEMAIFIFILVLRVRSFVLRVASDYFSSMLTHLLFILVLEG